MYLSLQALGNCVAQNHMNWGLFGKYNVKQLFRREFDKTPMSCDDATINNTNRKTDDQFCILKFFYLLLLFFFINASQISTDVAIRIIILFISFSTCHVYTLVCWWSNCQGYFFYKILTKTRTLSTLASLSIFLCWHKVARIRGLLI